MSNKKGKKQETVEPLLVDVVSQQLLSPTKFTVGKHMHAEGVCVKRIDESEWFAGAHFDDAAMAHKVLIALVTELGPSAAFEDGRTDDNDVSVVTMDPALVGPIVRIIKPHLN